MHRRAHDPGDQVAVGNRCADLVERVAETRDDAGRRVGQGAVEIEEHQLGSPGRQRFSHGAIVPDLPPPMPGALLFFTVTVRLADIIEVLDAAYPPALAQSWDSVGLVCGDPADAVESVTVAVDATAAVVDDVPDRGLLLAHHPLLLRGVDSVAASTPKGALVHRLIRTGRSLFTAHTNADSAAPGVSDALADALGLTVVDVLEPASAGADLDKWVIYVPPENAEAVRTAVFDAGAGQIGDYSCCSWSVPGTGQFLPHDGATPAIGRVGTVERLAEDRVEVIAPARLRAAVLAAMRGAHPYEEPAFDVIELAALPAGVGLGRIAELPQPEPLRDFVARVGARLPATSWGVRASGDPDLPVSRVAVCGGAGDSLLDTAARAGVQAYLTADLRHHPADEHRRASDVALVDVAHWASEYPVVRPGRRGAALALRRRPAGACLDDPHRSLEPAAHRESTNESRCDTTALTARAGRDRCRAEPDRAPRAPTSPSNSAMSSCRPSTATANDRVAVLRIAIEDLDGQVGRLESEIDGVRKREDRDRALLDSPATNAKQLTELQHELETLQRRQASLEDSLLEVMERREQLQGEQAAGQAAVDGVQRELTAARQARDAALAEIEQTRGRPGDGAARTWSAAVDSRSAGACTSASGAGALQGRRCGACRIEIDRGELSRIAAAADDDVLAVPGVWRDPVAGHRGRRREGAGDQSSRPTAARAATRGRPATGRWCSPPIAPRCWPRASRPSDGPPTTSPNTAA